MPVVVLLRLLTAISVLLLTGAIVDLLSGSREAGAVGIDLVAASASALIAAMTGAAAQALMLLRDIRDRLPEPPRRLQELRD